MRICLACKHFYFESGSPGYSEVTPGSPMQMECSKGHWKTYDDYMMADGLFTNMLRAEACADYEVSDLAKSKGFV